MILEESKCVNILGVRTWKLDKDDFSSDLELCRSGACLSALDFCCSINYRSASGVANKLPSYKVATIKETGKKLAVISVDDARTLAVRKKEEEFYNKWFFEAMRTFFGSTGSTGLEETSDPEMSEDGYVKAAEEDPADKEPVKTEGKNVKEFSVPCTPGAPIPDIDETRGSGVSRPPTGSYNPRVKDIQRTASEKDQWSNFRHPAFGNIEVISQDGAPWFIAQSVCDALHLGRQQDSTRYLDEDEKSRCLVDTPNGKTPMVIINEPGLYSLIMRSRRPEAKAFKHWVTHEVLPSIRKHGAYVTKETLEELIQRPESLKVLVDSLVEERRKRENAEIQIKSLEADAKFGNLISNTKSDVLVETVAKELTKAGWRINRDQLFYWLREEGLLCKNKGRAWNTPTMHALDRGYFNPKEHLINEGTPNERICLTTYVTGTGQRYIMDTIMSRYPMGPVPVPASNESKHKRGGLISRLFGKQQELSL